MFLYYLINGIFIAINSFILTVSIFQAKKEPTFINVFFLIAEIAVFIQLLF